MTIAVGVDEQLDRVGHPQLVVVVLERADDVAVLDRYVRVEVVVVPRELRVRLADRLGAALGGREVGRHRREPPAGLRTDAVDRDRAARVRDVHRTQRRRRPRQIDVEAPRDHRAVERVRPDRRHSIADVVAIVAEESDVQRRGARLPVGPQREIERVADDLAGVPARDRMAELHVGRVEVHEIGRAGIAAQQREHAPARSWRDLDLPDLRDPRGLPRDQDLVRRAGAAVHDAP